MKSYENLDFNTILRSMYDPISDEKAEDLERHFTSLEDRGFTITRWEIENLKELNDDEARQLRNDYEADYNTLFEGIYLVRIDLNYTIEDKNYDDKKWDLIFVKHKDKWYYMEVFEIE